MDTRTLAHLIEQIHKLSSSELKRQTELLAEQEHLQVARLIAHLAEVSLRRLHLELGYRSLFEYCTKRLGLSEGCTALRIQVCRVCRRHPLILDALAGQQISLTVAGKLAPHLKAENRERLIADCTGMTKREVEEYLVHLAPKPALSSGAQKRPAPAPAPDRATAPANPAPSDEGRADAESVPPATPPKPPSPAPKQPGSAEPCQPDIYNLRFAADKGFMDKLLRAAEVGGMGNACRNMARIFERALDAYLEKNDPWKRQERREKRASPKARAEAEVEAEAEKVTAEPAASDAAARSRTIPTSLRDRLLIRAGHRCEYRGSDGLRCSERSRLAIDHIEPWSLGGTSEEKNLRVYCFAHNRLYAEQCFGAEFINQKIESARTDRRRQSGHQPPCLNDPTSGGGQTRPDEVTDSRGLVIAVSDSKLIEQIRSSDS